MSTLANRHSASQSLWMVAAALSFALMAHCIKFSLEDMGAIELNFYRSLGGALVIGALIAFGRGSFMPRHYRLHFWRSAWGLLSIFQFYFALNNLPTSIAYSLNYTSPLFFMVLVAIVMHEKLGLATLAALLVSFSGAVMLLDPNFGSATFYGSLAGLGSGLCAGCAFFFIRRLGNQGEGGRRTVFYFNLHGILFSALMLLVLQEATGINADNFLVVTGVIVFATTGQLALTQALHKGASGATAALHFSGILFALAIDAGFIGIDFELFDYAGIALICIGGAISLWMARRRARDAVAV